MWPLSELLLISCFLLCYLIVYVNSVAVAHQIYGVAHTINSANYTYFKALEKVLSLNHPQCINIFTGKCLMWEYECVHCLIKYMQTDNMI